MPRNYGAVGYHRNSHQNKANKLLKTQPIRLSQCMIVKNEEKNIEKALSWAKGIAFEQIVVDTGSTDRTIEIAESMGAKVFHFQWIDDFSAAKNFAISKAKGNWIAFLDADEYFSDSGSKRLLPALEEIRNDPLKRDIIAVIETPLVNIEDNGEEMSTSTQRRIFRNMPSLRYIEKIHERLLHTQEQAIFDGSMTIYHTGYSASAIKDQNKSERNVTMLRSELEKKPNDINLKGYLADSLSVDKSKSSNEEEALALYAEVVASDEPLNSVVADSSYNHMILFAMKNSDYYEMIRLCERAKLIIFNDPDIYYWHGYAHFALGQYQEAWVQFRECEDRIEGRIQTRFSEENVGGIFDNLARTAHKLGDFQSVFKYATLALTLDKYLESMLTSALVVLRVIVSEDDKRIIDYLKKLYDFSNAKDKLFMAKCAKAANDQVLMVFFYQMLTAEEKQLLSLGEF